MPRYYFQVYLNGESASIDTEGVELADEDAAFVEATTSCGQMIHDLDGSLRAPTEWRMEVANARGTTLFRLFFRAERSG